MPMTYLILDGSDVSFGSPVHAVVGNLDSGLVQQAWLTVGIHHVAVHHTLELLQ